MNRLMEKIEGKFAEIGRSIVLHFFANALAMMVSLLAAILFVVNGAANERRVVFIVAYILATILSLLLCYFFARDYKRTVDFKLRELKNVVYIALHHEEDKLPDLEKDEGEHIPNLF